MLYSNSQHLRKDPNRAPLNIEALHRLLCSSSRSDIVLQSRQDKSQKMNRYVKALCYRD